MTAINDFPNYLIYEDGRVFSIKSDRFLSPCKIKGYLHVGLCKNRKRYMKRVHRLLAETFIPNPDNKPEVDHIDRNKTNNNLSNLRWATKSENMLNIGVRRDNKLGLKNICYDKFEDRYKFEKVINKIKHTKCFKTKEEAISYKEQYLLDITDNDT